MMTKSATLIGFDSAWTDNTKAPGAICAIHFDGFSFSDFRVPRLVGFDAAASFSKALSNDGTATILALDQPTIVPNPTGMRPVEKVAASLVSWVGGGVQPANRGRLGMFDDSAPLWRFRDDLGVIEDPFFAKQATSGLHMIEVFPALALPSFSDAFFGRKLGPRYNPSRRTFRLDHWHRVVAVTSAEATRIEAHEVTEWLRGLTIIDRPTKADQDRLDAVICLLIAIRWRMGEPHDSAMIGDLLNGYIVTPTSPAARFRLSEKAVKLGVPFSP